MFIEPVVRAYAAPQRGAMFIEPWSVRTRHPSGVQCVEVARSRYDAQVITLLPAGVRHWKRRASINMQLLAELSREGDLGLQRPELWHIINQPTERFSAARRRSLCDFVALC
jgi:hypothetical protein